MKIIKRKPIIEYDDDDIIDEKILKIRGIEKDKMFDFIMPNEKYLNSPFLLKNMDIAVEKVIQAISEDKKIGVYADVDTDGVTSAGIIKGYLSVFSDNVVYLSNQRVEGHGVIVNKVPMDIDLLIIVDSSTNSVEECKQLTERGVDIVTLDHHGCDIYNPYATIINPHMCDYPNKDLSGAGVCWQFCRAFDEVNGLRYANDFVDLACVGLVGDMMSMKSMENRYIVWLGLTSIHKGIGNKGLLSLFKELGKQYKPTSADISYYVSPCLSAIIRLSDIFIIFDLFDTQDSDVAKMMAKDIIAKNEERKALTDRIFKELYANLPNDKVVILDVTEQDYPKGLLGLIANKFAHELQKPCLVGKVVDGEFSGSGRGYGEEIGLKDELLDSGFFNLVAGHQNAFGVRFDINKLDKIRKHFNKAFKNYYNELYIEYDLALRYEDLTEANLKLVDMLNFISGQGFETPKFLIEGINIDSAKKIGKNENHTKLTKNDDMNLDIMKFNTEEGLEEYQQADYINVVGQIGINEFYNFGRKELVLTKQVLSDIIICEKIDI